VFPAALAAVLLLAAAELPRPSYDNCFCLCPINEAWHLRRPGDEQRLRSWAAEMRTALGAPGLYTRLGVAVISEGDERALCQLTRELGLVLVFQGGAIDHHANAWGFDKLLGDPLKGDRRFAQWLNDGSLGPLEKPIHWDFGVRACASRYAQPVYELRRAVETARAARIARSFREFPDVVIADSGPIECEMHNVDGRLGDYSPFTLAEFRDWLTHRGLYAPGAERADQGFPGGERFADDPSPDQAHGDHPTFNAVFGTHFTTWTLRYWDPLRYPNRVPLDAPGLPPAGAEGLVGGGFDAPRAAPGHSPPAGLAAEGNEAFWQAWSGLTDDAPGFRSRLLNWWIRDHIGWLAAAGIGREHLFSHQIPGESYGLGRLRDGASMVRTAATPDGSIGITTYFGAASDAPLWAKMVRLNPNWGIFEYHPHPIDALQAPISEYLHSLRACVRFRAHILTPIAWNETGKDFRVNIGPFAAAMAQELAALPDQPYYNRAYVAYAPPPVTGIKTAAADGQTVVTWSPRIWPDLPHLWTDWREFDRFEVRDGAGRVLAAGRAPRATVAGAPAGLTVVAVSRPSPPPLPAVAGVTGRRGRLAWDEAADFFLDHYEVQVLDGPQAVAPARVLRAEEANAELRPAAGERSAWVRVAAADAAGRLGPLSPPFDLTLDRPGRLLADLTTLPATVTDSPDCAVRPIAVGGLTEPSLFEHPPLTGNDWARAAYTLNLPPVAAGQQILLLADLGLKDGAEASGGVIFRVELDGAAELEQRVGPDHRWHPIEVDLTAAAGGVVKLSLLTNPGGSSVADWAAWGEPRVLLCGPGVTDRPQVTGVSAEGKTVRGRVTLRWSERASDGSLWSAAKGLTGFRVYRGADRGFAPSPTALLGQTPAREFVDNGFDGSQTFYRVTARFDDGGESPASEAIQFAP
jgi:hypothetical protein